MVITWDSWWGQVKSMPIQTLQVMGQELGDDFPDWISSRTPKIQMEILKDAPESFKKYLYAHKDLSRVTVLNLGIDPRMDIHATRIVNNRSKK